MALALACAALVAAVSACSGDPPVGPLGKVPENHTVVSQPVQNGGADTIGFEPVFNSGSVPAVVDRVVLVSPRHIKLIGAYLTIGGPIGNWATFPPRITKAFGDGHIRRAWANRHVAAGAVIPPHQWAGIALGLEATAAHGSVAATELFYHVGSAHYEWRGKMRIVLTRTS